MNAGHLSGGGRMSNDTAIAEYSHTEAALATLVERYRGVVYDVTQKPGMTDALKARREIREIRTTLEKTRVEIKGPALKRCQQIDSEAKRITSALLALEDPIDAQIKKEETRKADEAAAIQRVEAERIAAEERAKREAEEQRLADERAEIARRQAELDRAEREAKERIEAERRAEEERRHKAELDARAKIDAEERESRRKIEEAERFARLKREEEERKARADREAKEAALKVERDKLEAERRAVEERARKEREAREAEEREIQRKKNDVLDGRAMLEAFVRRFGKLPEFSQIASTINEFLTGGQK